jgi:hypothetical protein
MVPGPVDAFGYIFLSLALSKYLLRDVGSLNVADTESPSIASRRSSGDERTIDEYEQIAVLI